MKFSLQTLVLMTLVAALFTNYFIIVTNTNRSYIKLQKVTEQLEVSRYSIEHLQSSSGDQNENLERQRRQQRELIHAKSKLVSAFDRFASQAGGLDIDESKFSVKQIPNYTEPNRFVRSFNIFVPQSMSVAAKVYCYKQPIAEGSNRFMTTDDAMVELPSGQSQLTFRFEKCDDHESGSFDNVITLLLDGQLQHSWVIVGESSWYGIRASSAMLREQKDLTEMRKVQLIPEFQPSNSDHKLELSIVDLSASRNE